MATYSAGQAYIQLLPSLRTFKADADRQLKSYKPQVEVLLRPKVDPSALPEADRQGKQSGGSYADAFERVVQTRISAALSALPDIDPDVDTTEADNGIAEIKAALEALSRQKIGVDIDAEDALAELEGLRAELDEIAASDESIQIRVDAADAALKLAAISEDVKRLDGKDVDVHVKFDVDNASLAKADSEIDDVQKQSNRSGIGTGGAITGAAIAGSGPIVGASLVAIPALLGAIGEEAEKSDASVQKSLDDMKTAAKETAREGFEPLVPTLTAIEKQTKTTVEGMEGDLQQAAQGAAPLIQTLSNGLLQAATEGVHGVAGEVSSLKPLAQAVSDDFVKAERGLAGFGSNLNLASASRGLSELGSDVEEILPAVGSLLSEIMPVGNALLSVLGPAAKDTATDFSVLKPIISAVGSTISFLSPGIAAVVPPLLIVAAGSKLLTGSWTDLSGAGQKLLAPFKDWSGTLTSLANKVGITTASQNAETAASLKAAAAKASLVAEVDKQAVAELRAAGAAEGSAAEQLALVEAEQAARVSATEAAAAETALAGASEGMSFALGPVGIALGVIGFALSGFLGDSSDATNSAQDLTQQLVQLGSATPSAAASLVAGNQDLQTMADKFTHIGSSVGAFDKALAGGSQSASKYIQNLTTQQDKLGQTTIGMSQDASHAYQVQNLSQAQSVLSLKDLTDQVNQGKISNDFLSGSLRDQVAKYNDYNDVIAQAKKSAAELAAQQEVETQVLAQQGITISDTSKSWNKLGTDVGDTVSSFDDATSGIKSLSDNVVGSAEANQQAVASFAQLDAAVDQAEASYDQAKKGVASAAESLRQASQSVADARHSEAEAGKAVVAAEKGVETATKGVASAEDSLTSAQKSQAQAQESLTAARQQAAQQLQDLKRQVTDQGDSEAEARLRLEQAQKAVVAAGLQGKTLASLGAPTAANETSFQLLLEQSEAQHALNDTLAQGTQLRAQQAAADKAGVNGSSQVLQAQQQLTQAQQQSQQAAAALQTAKDGVTTASEGVANAQYSEEQAHLATGNAAYSEGQASQALKSAKVSETAASAALTAARADDSRNIDLNSAAGIRNWQTVEQLFEKNLAATGSIQGATTATEQQTAKMHLQKDQVDAVITSLTKVPAQTNFAIVGTPSLNLGALLKQATSEGISPYTLGLPSGDVTLALGPRGSSYARGGPISGPGGPTADVIPIMASDGEYMQPAHAVDYYGQSVMDAIRAKRIPKDALQHFANGGPIATDGKTLLGLNYRLAGWDATLQGAAAMLSAFGYPSIPALPKAVGQIDLGPFANLGASGAGAIGNANPAKNGSAAQAQAYAAGQLAKYGWGPEQMPPLIKLWNQESGWDDTIVNKKSGAAGIPQALGHGHVFDLGDYVAQVDWGLGYIKGRYGDPDAAWAHEVSHNWYDSGGWLPPGVTAVHNDTGLPEAVLTSGQWAAMSNRDSYAGLAGLDISGTLAFDSNGLVHLVDGRIEGARRRTGGAITTRTR